MASAHEVPDERKGYEDAKGIDGTPNTFAAVAGLFLWHILTLHSVDRACLAWVAHGVNSKC